MAKTLRDKNLNQIIYISLGGAIAVVILFIIIFNVFSIKKNNDNVNVQIGQENGTKDSSIEQANSSIGKKVEELNDYEEVNQSNSVQVKVDDNKQMENQIGEKQVNEKSVNKVDNQPENINEKITDSQKNETENNNISTADVENFSDEDVNSVNSEAVVSEGEEPKDPEFKMPVEGEIVKHYGKEKLIYSETLKEWTTHLGIDIKADKTSIVKASSDGIVKSIKNDPRYGLTVVLEHQNGFISVYSNLLTAEFVVVGETVKSGQTLGTVGNSATFEILDDSHLHFEILKDGNCIDPEMYIK